MTVAMRAVVALLPGLAVAASGCSGDTFVRLEITGRGIAQVDHLAVSVELGGRREPIEVPRRPVTFPTSMVLALPGAARGELTVEAEARDAADATLARARGRYPLSGPGLQAHSLVLQRGAATWAAIRRASAPQDCIALRCDGFEAETLGWQDEVSTFGGEALELDLGTARAGLRSLKAQVPARLKATGAQLSAVVTDNSTLRNVVGDVWIRFYVNPSGPRPGDGVTLLSLVEQQAPWDSVTMGIEGARLFAYTDTPSSDGQYHLGNAEVVTFDGTRWLCVEVQLSGGVSSTSAIMAFVDGALQVSLETAAAKSARSFMNLGLYVPDDLDSTGLSAWFDDVVIDTRRPGC